MARINSLKWSLQAKRAARSAARSPGACFKCFCGSSSVLACWASGQRLQLPGHRGARIPCNESAQPGAGALHAPRGKAPQARRSRRCAAAPCLGWGLVPSAGPSCACCAAWHFMAGRGGGDVAVVHASRRSSRHSTRHRCRRALPWQRGTCVRSTSGQEKLRSV